MLSWSTNDQSRSAPRLFFPRLLLSPTPKTIQSSRDFGCRFRLLQGRGRLSLSLCFLSLPLPLSPQSCGSVDEPLRVPVENSTAMSCVLVVRGGCSSPGCKVSRFPLCRPIQVGSFRQHPAPKARSRERERGHRARHVFSPRLSRHWSCWQRAEEGELVYGKGLLELRGSNPGHDDFPRILG